MDIDKIDFTAEAASIRLSISRSILPSLMMNKTPRYLNSLRQDLSTNLKWASHPFLTEDHGLGFGGADSHLSCFTLVPVHSEGPGLKGPTRHYPQRAERKSCGPQT